MALLQAKRGDTLRILGQHADRGATVPLWDATLRAEMSDGSVRLPLTCTILDEAAGLFEATLPAAVTEALVPGFYAADIEFTHGGGGVVSTDTFTVEILEDVTGAGD